MPSLLQGYRRKTIIDYSPYSHLEKDNINSYLDKIEKKIKQRKPMATNGFLVERLKRQSILNAKLFQKEGLDYEEKIVGMVKRLNEVLNRPNFIQAPLTQKEKKQQHLLLK